MYHTLLFDLDGTIINSKEGITKSAQYALSFFDIHESDLDKLEVFIGPPLGQSFQEYYHLSDKQTKKAVTLFRERYASIGVYENEVYDGIEDLLTSLKETGKKIALATSKPENFAIAILEKYKLSSYFDLIVGSKLDGSRDSKKEVIEEVFHRLSYSETDRKECIMIGDRKHDILGAAACNIDSIGVRYGFSTGQELEETNATFVLESVQELKQFLLTH